VLQHHGQGGEIRQVVRRNGTADALEGFGADEYPRRLAVEPRQAEAAQARGMCGAPVSIEGFNPVEKRRRDLAFAAEEQRVQPAPGRFRQLLQKQEDLVDAAVSAPLVLVDGVDDPAGLPVALRPIVPPGGFSAAPRPRLSKPRRVRNRPGRLGRA
jgi:hypothetical protein